MNNLLRRCCRLVCLTAAAIYYAGVAHAQGSAQAAMPGLENIPLFTIAWSLSNNVVHYDAKLRNGRFDPKEPVAAYWVMNQTDGHREDLTFIERLKAYGFSIKPGREPETWDMVIVSVKQKTLHIAKVENQLRVMIDIANCERAYLDHVFVRAHKWHMLNIPESAELIGNDAKTGAECREKVKQE